MYIFFIYTLLEKGISDFFTNENGEIVIMEKSERLEYLKSLVKEIREQILVKNKILFPDEIDYFYKSLKIELEFLLKDLESNL